MSETDLKHELVSGLSSQKVRQSSHQNANIPIWEKIHLPQISRHQGQYPKPINPHELPTQNITKKYTIPPPPIHLPPSSSLNNPLPSSPPSPPSTLLPCPIPIPPKNPCPTLLLRSLPLLGTGGGALTVYPPNNPPTPPPPLTPLPCNGLLSTTDPRLLPSPLSPLILVRIGATPCSNTLRIRWKTLVVTGAGATLSLRPAPPPGQRDDTPTPAARDFPSV